MNGLKGIKLRSYITSFLAVMAIFFIVGYLYLSNSSAYLFAKDFASKNTQVIKEIGQIKSAHLGLFHSHISYGDGNATAKIQVVLSGAEKSATVNLDLKGFNDTWLVQEGILVLSDGNTIVLDQNPQ